MNAPVINRFAKNITIGALRSGWTRRGRRLALTVPLAAVVAIGAVACDKPQTGSAAHATTPSAVASTPAAVTPAPSTAAPTTAPQDTDTPSAAPATSTPTKTATKTTGATGAGAKPGQGKGVAVRFDGLSAGSTVAAGGDTVEFSVTWTDESGRGYEGVKPVVASRFYEGGGCSIIAPMAGGKLERKDGDKWTALPLSQGTGMDYATTAEAAAFSLAPGASHTVQYRMQLSADDGTGTLPIEADAFLGPIGSAEKVGESVVNVQVVDNHRPSADFTAKLPGSVTVGGAAVEVETEMVNFSAEPFKAAALELNLLDVQTKPYETQSLLRPADVKAEVFWRGEWLPLKTTETCSGNTTGLVVDTAFLNQELAVGRGSRAMFRFSLKPSADPRLTALTVAVGAHADGHYAQLATRQLDVRR